MCCIYHGVEVGIKTKKAPVLDVRLHVTHHFVNSIRTAFISMSWQYLALNCEEELLPASASIVTVTKFMPQKLPASSPSLLFGKSNQCSEKTKGKS